MKTKAERDALIKDLQAQGVPKMWLAPPLTRLLWAVGLKTTPPIFLSSFQAGAQLGTSFGLAWGLIMYLISWGPQGYPIPVMAIGILLAGAMFGVIMGFLHSRARKSLREKGITLPEW